MAVADLGLDYSGNGNYWTPNNFSVTAGAGNDSLVDTPTPYGSDTGVGGEVRGNYATLNPLSYVSGTLANGNLEQTSRDSYSSSTLGTSTLAMESGKWYFEATKTSGASTTLRIGVVNKSFAIETDNRFLYDSAGTYTENGSTVASGKATYATNDVIGIALNADTKVIEFFKNGVSQGTYTMSIAGPYYATSLDGTTGSTCVYTWNFGQRPFAYTAPSGFKALCTTNLPTPTIGATSTTQANDYFDVLTYTGDGSSPRNITGLQFQPDFVWGKSRSNAYNNWLFDAVRGVSLGLKSNSTDAQITNPVNGYISAFNSDGFSVTAGTTDTENLNGNTRTYVAWNWKANGAGSSNTAGSITSTVSVSTTSGFSIVNWTGSTSTSAQTVGHGLGVTPQMVILRNRDVSDNWFVYHASVTNTSQYLTLNGTSGTTNNPNALWGAGMTSTLVGVRPASFCVATSDDVIMYVFAPVAGYSAFGSYTGNGSTDGPFVYTGFRPRYVLIKRTDTTGTWLIEDTGRNTYNLTDLSLSTESSAAELTQTTAGNPIDILSSGFKCRGTGASSNANTGTYIYAAFAESPFKYSLAR